MVPRAAAIGLDIGGTSVKAALVDLRGEALQLGQSEPYSKPDRAGLVAAIAEAVPDSITLGTFPVSVGLCVPGVLDEAAGVVERAVNVSGLEGVPLRELVAESIEQRIKRLVLQTDAEAAGRDVAASMSVRGRLLVVSIGTGVGAAVLDDGHPLRVTGRSAGHFGQIDVGPCGLEPIPVGPDGGRGGLEAYVGLPALRARFGEGLEEAVANLRDDDPVMVALSRAMRIAHAIYRPDVIVLLGGVGVRLEPVVERLRDLVADGLTGVARDGWRLGCGWSDHHAARGAGLAALRDRGI